MVYRVYWEVETNRYEAVSDDDPRGQYWAVTTAFGLQPDLYNPNLTRAEFEQLARERELI